MFGKKILSIVGLLFLGSRITTVSATTQVCRISLTKTENVIDGCAKGTAEAEEEIVCADGYYAVFSDTINNSDKVNDETAGGAGKLIKLSTGGTVCDIIGTGVGYFTSGETGKYISRKADGAVALVGTVAGESTTSCPAGKLTGEGKLCIGETIGDAITLANGKDYLVTNAYSIFSDTTTDLYAVTYDGTEKTLLKKEAITGANEYCVNAGLEIMGTKANFCAGGTCTGYYLCTDGKCVRSDTEECPATSDCSAEIPANGGCNVPGYYLTTTEAAGAKLLQGSDANGYLYLCTALRCDPVTAEVGYYKSAVVGNLDYIRCDGTDCKPVTATATTTGCDENGVKIGDVVNKNSGTFQICLGTGAEDGVVLDSAHVKKVITTGAANNLGRDDTSSYILNIDGKNAFIQINASKDEYYLKDTDANGLEETDTAGTLLKCASGPIATSTSGKCTEVGAETKVGYYKNAGSATNTYIKCEIGTGIECKPHVPIAVEATTGCGATKKPDGATALDNALAIGDLINDDGTIQLCLGLNKATGITVGTVSSYFISVNDANIFGSNAGHYVLVEFDTLGNALRDKTANDASPRYRYTNSAHLISANNENDVCKLGAPTAELVEFKYNKCDSASQSTADGVPINYYSIVIYL